MSDKLVKWLAPIAKSSGQRFFWQEFLGSGVPHVLLGMNLNERIDQFYQQAAQEVGSYMATFQFSKGVEKIYDAHLNTLKHGTAEQKNALAWKGLGVALATLPVLAATDYSAMYLRNYLTSKTFKTHNFVDLVGLGDDDTDHKKKNATETDVHKKERYAFERTQLETIGKAVGLSLAIGGVTSGWAYHQMKKGADLPAFLTKQFKVPFTESLAKVHNQLKKGRLKHLAILFPEKGGKTSLQDLLSFKNRETGEITGDMGDISDLQVFSSFGTFGYSGLILSARDPVERFEAIVKFAWYGFANMVIPNIVQKSIEPTLDKKFGKHSDKKAVYSFLATVATGAGLYAMPPTVACLFTRKDRSTDYKAQQAKTAPPMQNAYTNPMSSRQAPLFHTN
ncbi:MAG: hypothetical protein LW809_04895 [Vampirovibrionales bacterium]|jgi:hypothetical protein|nr:hypothetical protein [Vampirovibrionales bacterium]